MQPVKTTAKDFFLHLGMIVSMYAGIGFILNLLFTVINSAFPKVDQYYYYTSSISFPVAALIILTPVFLILTSLIAKAEASDPSRKEIWIKRWSTYLTMFITGAVAVGDLIAVLYVFLDGQDLTSAFFLKVLAVFVVAVSVFAYFWMSLKGELSSKVRLYWRIWAVALVAIPIILGFMVIGSPRTQRLVRYDVQKVQDLQGVQNEIISYFQTKGTVPMNLEELQKSSLYFTVPKDMQNGESYGYEMIAKNSFKLCANFNKASDQNNSIAQMSPYMTEESTWTHGEGNVCFERTLDADRYPLLNQVNTKVQI